MASILNYFRFLVLVNVALLVATSSNAFSQTQCETSRAELSREFDELKIIDRASTLSSAAEVLLTQLNESFVKMYQPRHREQIAQFESSHPIPKDREIDESDIEQLYIAYEKSPLFEVDNSKVKEFLPTVASQFPNFKCKLEYKIAVTQQVPSIYCGDVDDPGLYEGNAKPFFYLFVGPLFVVDEGDRIGGSRTKDKVRITISLGYGRDQNISLKGSLSFGFTLKQRFNVRTVRSVLTLKRAVESMTPLPIGSNIASIIGRLVDADGDGETDVLYKGLLYSDGNFLRPSKPDRRLTRCYLQTRDYFVESILKKRLPECKSKKIATCS